MIAWCSEVAGAWGQTLWQLSWQIAILSGFVWLASLFCRRLPANFQYWLWCIVLIRLCIPIQYSLPTGITDDVRQTAELCVQSVLVRPDVALATTLPATPPLDDATVAPVSMRMTLAWVAILVVIVAGVSRRILQVRRALSECPSVTRPALTQLVEQSRVRCGIHYPVNMRRASPALAGKGPAVIGFFRPTIVLPTHMVDRWNLSELEPVVLHELAHIKRGDLWVNLVQLVVQTVYFFHPLVWYVNWRIRQVREEVCDDLAVLHLGGERKRYGSSLLRVIEECEPESDWALVQARMAEPKTSLGRRVVRIMNKNYRSHHRLSLRAIFGLALVGLCAIGISGGNTRGEDAALPQGLSALTEEAEALYEAKEYSNAIMQYERISKEYPETNEAANAMMMVGVCLDWMGDAEKALAAFEEAVKTYPDRKRWSEAIWFYLADAYRQGGREEDAMKAYAKCVELCEGVREPDRFPYADALGWVTLTPVEGLFEAGQYEEAIKGYTAIAEDRPNWNYAEHALMMVGLCQEKMGNLDKAIEAYHTAVSKYPDLAGWTETAWYYLGRAYESTGKPGEALGAYRESVNLCERALGRSPDSFPWQDAKQRIAELEASGS